MASSHDGTCPSDLLQELFPLCAGLDSLMYPYPQSSLLRNALTMTLSLSPMSSIVHSHSLSCGPGPLRKLNWPDMSVLIPPPSQSNKKQTSYSYPTMQPFKGAYYCCIGKRFYVVMNDLIVTGRTSVIVCFNTYYQL